MTKQTKLLAILACIAILLPFLAIGGAAFALPSQYEKTFLGALRDKLDRLSSIDGAKIVVIGGSSAAFGLDSALIEEHTGMPVVNFGLYASLGTKMMLDLSRDYIGEGDIVILAPETDPQTLSLYFNAESAWQAADGAPQILAGLDFDDFGAMVGGLWDFAAAKYAFFADGNAPDPAGVYNRANLNEYGDIDYERPYNVMPGGVDSTTVVRLEPETADAEFLAYVNEYTAHCEKRGAKVYFSFSPINEAALAEGTDEDSLAAFTLYLAQTLDCEIISDLRACIMEREYFYDTNFHLNDAGVTVNTARLIGDIRRVQANPAPFVIELPEMPALPDIFVDESLNDTTGYFVCEDVNGVLTLTGITDAGKAQTTLTLPRAMNGIAVQTVAENAFAGCENLETIVIPADTRLSLLDDGAFAGAPKLTRIEVKVHPDVILVGDELMRGAVSAAYIYVEKEYYGDYAAHYFWSEYMKVIFVG